MVENIIKDSIGVELTSFCPNKCIMCPKGLKNYKELRPNQGNMSLENLDIILKKIKVNYEKVEISFCQDGDVLCYPHLDEAVKMVNDIGYTSCVVTNGVLLNRDKIDFLIKTKPPVRFTYDLYGSTRESYKRVAGVDNFDLCLSNLKYLASIKDKYNFDIECSCIKELLTEEERKLWSDIMIDLNLPHVFTNINPYPYLNIEEYQPNIINLRKTKKPPCVQPFSSLNINWDATIGPCCLNFGMYHVGSLLENSLDEIFFGEKFTELRNKHHSGDLSGLPCQNCEVPYMQPANGWDSWFKRG